MAHPVRAFLLAIALTNCASTDDTRVEAAETVFADYFDAIGARDTIDSGLVESFEGASRAEWEARHQRSLAALRSALSRVDPSKLTAVNTRAYQAMQEGIAWRESSSAAPEGNCADAQGAATGEALNAALYACFSSLGDAIEFEGRRYARTAALAALEKLEEPERRRGLFMAMAPLWQSVNTGDEPTSPYRRLIALQSADAQRAIANAEAALGAEAGSAEAWLEGALSAWSDDDAPLIEPWDFRYSYAAAVRETERCAPLAALRPANDHYFTDLGADLRALGVIQDVGDRPGMAPVDYADFARIGRELDGAWRPAIPRISVVLQEGGIAHAAELAHENGHAAHYAAMRARPSLIFPDDFTVAIEAFADINAWSVYTPAWQQRYLGCSADEATNLRARLGAVMLDMAWGLFEIRMARDPSQSPNLIWTEITETHLRIAPHPELSWWAVRGQLVESPGYMIHYALGAFITAEVRARIAAEIGGFDAGNPNWYPHLSETLYGYGGTLPPAELLEAYLGRPVGPDALIADIERAR
ncbi:MAG: hypothetical protein AB7G05_05665 [Hyphomonadaceae bacterium]